MTPCACMGPQYGEPHCVCQMKARGMPLNEEARAKANAEFRQAMTELFGPGGRYSNPTNNS